MRRGSSFLTPGIMLSSRLSQFEMLTPIDVMTASCLLSTIFMDGKSLTLVRTIRLMPAFVFILTPSRFCRWLLDPPRPSSKVTDIDAHTAHLTIIHVLAMHSVMSAK